MTRPHAPEGDQPPPSLWVRATSTLLGTNRRRRADLGGYLLSCAVYLMGLALLQWAGFMGFCDLSTVTKMSVGIVLSVAFFYFVLRFDAGRLSMPAIVSAQMVLAVAWIACAYAVAGPFRGVTLMIMTLVQVFGMFYLRINFQALVAAYAFAVMSAVMAVKIESEPLRYSATTEFPYFLTMATSLLATLVLGVKLSALRDRLKAQKRELRITMARLEQMASHDELTGLFNRRQMTELVDQQIKQYARYEHSFCLALVDLDHFKRINDTQGHGIGDEVLRNFAQQVQLFIREADSVARWGGEEFLILFPQASLHEANLALQRLQDKLRVATICPRAQHLRLSFSAGLVQFHPDEKIEKLIERADRALYTAKSGGRARTISQ